MASSFVLFQGLDLSGDAELWVTDGAPGGTSEISVVGAASTGLEPSQFAAFGSEVLFDGTDTNGLAGLWVTNGTTGGTSELSVAGASSMFGLAPGDFAVLGNEALFEASDSSHSNPTLWVTNGMLGGTSEVSVPDASPDGVYPNALTVFGSEVLFSGFGSSPSSSQLWITNGTTEGTSELSVAGTSAHGLVPGPFIVFGSEVLFDGEDHFGAPQLWVTNGTGPGTSELSVAGSWSGGLFPFAFAVLGSEVLFAGRDTSGGSNLWVTNGTGTGTSELTIAGAASAGLFPTGLAVFGSEVLFAGNDTSGHTNLWVTNGTVGRTSELSVAAAYSGGMFYNDTVPDFTVFGSEVLFDGADSNGDDNLWVTNGTGTGTSELSVEGAFSGGLVPFEITAVNLVGGSAPCFAAGTRIATEHGEVAVEAIGVGAQVRVLLGAGLAKVVWAGRREVDCGGHEQPCKVWPVRVAAGAFGPGRPHRDLFLSPDHAVFVEEVLIPVRHLINGSTIVQQPVKRVTYHHLELAEHDVLLAEGLPAESFLNIRDGRKYPDRAGPIRLYPDYAARMWEAFGCARLVVTGPELTAARAFVARFATDLAA